VKGKILTQYSSHANTIADTVRAAFAKTKVGDNTVEMTAPSDSTKGGLLALQHLTLKPASGMALVVGTVNAGEKHADLRSYAHVAMLNEERFKKPLSFDEPTYKTFLEKAESVLGAFGIETTVTDPPADASPSLANARDTRPAPRSLGPILIAFGVAMFVAVIAAIWVALRR
jgi:hypothetical protein